jgi:hypothetical protein
MTLQIKWKKYKSYSGVVIKGETEFQPPAGDREKFHVDRAFWLTSKVETGARFGSVMNYDGTAMTAGLDQHIAVYPRELSRPDDGNALDDQGTLWKLLRRLETVSGTGLVKVREALWKALRDIGCYVAQDGVLRYLANGEPVPGEAIRDSFTPMKGQPTLPSQKKQAEYWIRLFHDLFAHPATYAAQVGYGVEHLVKRTNRRVLDVRTMRHSPMTFPRRVSEFYPQEITACKLDDDWSLEEDLAMCMYQSHSVNAPAIANKTLAKVFGYTLRNQVPKGGWPKKLIRLLGNSKYGRWDDDLKYGRYQRTRSAARASKLWPTSLFDGKKAIMPKDLVG